MTYVITKIGQQQLFQTTSNCSMSQFSNPGPNFFFKPISIVWGDISRWPYLPVATWKVRDVFAIYRMSSTKPSKKAWYMWQVLVMKKWNFSLPLCSVGTVGATCILSWPGSTKYWSESCFNDAAFLLLYKAFQSSVRTMSNTFCFSLGRSGVWSAFSSFRPMTSITWWNMAVTSMWIKLLHSQCSVKHVND